MTDKVQKIREKVEKRYEYWKGKESNSHSIESEIRMSECQHLLLMLDSLQEEPVSIWHDTSENPKEEEYLICVYKDNRYHIGKIYKDEFNRLLVSDNKNIIELCMFEKWAYIDDILKLSNVQRTTKNWKGPVSDEIRRITMTKEEAIKFLQQLYPNGGHCWLDEQRMEAIGMAVKALQEEPVSIWHEGCEIPESKTNILMLRKDVKDSNYPPIAGCFHGTNTRLDGRNWGYYNGFCYNEIEPPVKWAYIDDILNLSNVELPKEIEL